MGMLGGMPSESKLAQPVRRVAAARRRKADETRRHEEREVHEDGGRGCDGGVMWGSRR